MFTVLPLEPEQFLAFRPLGFMAPPIHMFPAKHSAFSMTRPGDRPVPVPLRAPGEMWIEEIWEASFSTGGANYQVFAYPCREVRVYWGHLSAIADRLRVAYAAGSPTCNSFSEGRAIVTTCRRSGLGLPVAAGEIFGQGPDAAGIDLGVIDFRRAPAPFVRPEHYDGFYPYYASPLEYFAPEPRARLAAKTGNVFGQRVRTANPVGGSHAQDVAGTAAGNWFPPGVDYRRATDVSGGIGLATDFVDPSQPIIAMGTRVPGAPSGLYAFAPRTEGTINRPFHDVRADGKVYCYEQFASGSTPGGMPLGRPGGVLLLALSDAMTLRVEHLAASRCPRDAERSLSSAATSFER